MIGVGLVGAGPGAASLHAPTLARIDGLSLVHISDGGSGRADALAALHRVRASTGIDDLLADDEVEAVALCSPPALHADQIVAAAGAGVRGILCEKPFAVTKEDAIRAVEACRSAGVALVLGTQHRFDPAWQRVRRDVLAGAEIRSVSVTASLPPNGRYHEVVSEPGEAIAVPPRPRPDLSDPGVVADLVRQLVLGLLVHDLPLLRELVPRIDEVVFARPIPPVGVSVGLRGGDTVVHLLASMQPGGADALWRMTIGTDSDVVDLDFAPAFVHGRSAAIRVHRADGSMTSSAAAGDDGYVAEWQALLGALRREAPTDYDDVLADALYAIDLADAAASAAREAMPS